ncbi:hypothetical protein LSTR_LSTR002275 [Laodelphax striatellus]|uniref:Rho-GAP domain-containing protein n=1 Tax=Laodelphax striatellus TaxID=195883 RepID=A0A482XFK9_LAOST|nr:hypothetical protein LSTR_LSTR002275 [Laodelphax striatellus]
MEINSKAPQRKLFEIFDKLITSVDIVSENYNDTITGFYDFVLGTGNLQNICLESEKKVHKLEDEVKALEKEKQHLENKLQIARRIHDNSIAMRKKAEEEKMALEIQLQQVRDLLFCDTRNKIHDETREKLQSLSTSFMSRTSLDRMDYNAGGDKLTTIDEFESTGSILSDLSYSRSEDDLDHNETRRLRKRSYAYTESAGTKRRSVSRRSYASVNASPGDCLVSTTRLVVNETGAPSASTVIRAYTSPPSTVIPPQLATVPSAPKEDSDTDPVVNYTPTHVKPSESRSQLYTTPSSTNFFPFQSNTIYTRTHNITTKNVLKPENCDPCGKKIKFGRTALKCLDCRTVCHMECRDQLSLPCIPPGNVTTPKGNSQMMAIADYAPPTSPMIPALVVHCINEIEKRGPKETGIYRIPGPSKEVKALKERFLRGRGVPNMGLVSDIHTVCSCLKEFLITLKEPLATHALWSKFVKASENEDSDAKQAELYQTFTELPQPNRDTLAFLILHLQRVAQMPKCCMSIKSLSDIFGPTIIGQSQPDLPAFKAFVEAKQSCNVLQALLEIPSDYWNNFLNTQETHSAASTPREQCGFMYSPMSAGRFTVRKKRE